MLTYLRETTRGEQSSRVIAAGEVCEDEGTVSDEDQEPSVNNYQGKRYAVLPKAPSSHFAHAKTSVKFCEHIKRKHNGWIEECITQLNTVQFCPEVGVFPEDLALNPVLNEIKWMDQGCFGLMGFEVLCSFRSKTGCLYKAHLK